MKQKVIDYLSNYCVSERNITKGYVIARYLEISQVDLREHIKALRMDGYIIGATNRGYYLPTKEEHFKAVRYSENKTISHIETNVMQRPTFILELYKKLNELKKTLPEAIHGQIGFDESGNFVEVDLYGGSKNEN